MAFLYSRTGLTKLHTTHSPRHQSKGAFQYSYLSTFLKLIFIPDQLCFGQTNLKKCLKEGIPDHWVTILFSYCSVLGDGTFQNYLNTSPMCLRLLRLIQILECLTLIPKNLQGSETRFWQNTGLSSISFITVYITNPLDRLLTSEVDRHL